jgi:hypothetical protein
MLRAPRSLDAASLPNKPMHATPMERASHARCARARVIGGVRALLM